MINKKRKENIIAVAVCIIVSLLGVVFIYKLWKFDFEVPLYYLDGDHLFTLTTLKRSSSLREFFHSSNLGAPFSATNFDFPFMGDIANIVYFKIFTCIFDCSMGLNIGYFMLFPITAAISFIVMKKFGIANIWAILGSVTFSFLPYRLLRNTAHLFLNCYYQIPIAVLFCFWLIQDDKFLTINKSFFQYKRNIIGVFGFILIAYTGIYYAFFTAFFVCVSIVYKMWNQKNVSCIKNGIAACLLICIPLVIGYMPNFLFQLKNGANLEAPARNPIEAEIYGMKIAQLFIPLRDYGVNWLKSIQEAYKQAPVSNEGSEYLGLAGIIGFVLLIFYLFRNQQNNGKSEEQIVILSKLNCFAVLLGTIGGFGSLFALGISSQIRAYNRISVFIAYFSILGFCILLTKIWKRNKKIYLMGVCLIFLLGFLDQARTENYSIRQQMENSYYSDKKFVNAIKECVSENAMIYQWVYQPYPENPPIQNMGDYASFRGYLHSDHLKWSYGDYKGRDADMWNRNLASKTLKERINIISNVGFEGIYIDTYAYSEEELAQLLKTMQSILKTDPLYSEDKRFVFFSLSSYVKQYKAQFTEVKWNKMKNENLTNIRFLNGFYDIETADGHSWRWGEQRGLIRVIQNTSDSKATLHIKLFSGTEEKVKFTVASNEEKKEYYIDSQGADIFIPITEETTNIWIDTEGAKVDAPDDTRELYMRIEDVSIEYEE